MTSERKKPGVAFWATVVVVVAISFDAPVLRGDDVPTPAHIAEVMRAHLTDFQTHHSVILFRDQPEDGAHEDWLVTVDLAADGWLAAGCRSTRTVRGSVGQNRRALSPIDFLNPPRHSRRRTF